MCLFDWHPKQLWEESYYGIHGLSRPIIAQLRKKFPLTNLRKSKLSGVKIRAGFSALTWVPTPPRCVQRPYPTCYDVLAPIRLLEDA